MTHDLFFIQDFHGIHISGRYRILSRNEIVLLNEVNLPETSLTEFCSDSEVLRSDFIFFKLVLHKISLPLFSFLPNCDEFLLPSFVVLLILTLFLFFSRLLFLVFVLDILDHLLNCIVLLEKLFVNILILRHQLLHHIHTIIVSQYTVECCSTVLRIVWVLHHFLLLLNASL